MNTASRFAMTALAVLTSVSAYAAKTGAPAPAFSGTDMNGKKIELSQYKGKFVVLEWHNKDCPFVKEAYGSGKMQATQKEWTGKGVVWLTVDSSAPGQQGNVDGAGAIADIKAHHSNETTMILDPTGAIGHAYDAKTTPHMFVIDPNGTLIYNGAIDDKHIDDNGEGKPQGVNYVDLALRESMVEKKAKLSHATSTPYGCSVKYGSGT